MRNIWVSEMCIQNVERVYHAIQKHASSVKLSVKINVRNLETVEMRKGDMGCICNV